MPSRIAPEHGVVTPVNKSQAAGVWAQQRFRETALRNAARGDSTALWFADGIHLDPAVFGDPSDECEYPTSIFDGQITGSASQGSSEAVASNHFRCYTSASIRLSADMRHSRTGQLLASATTINVSGAGQLLDGGTPGLRDFSTSVSYYHGLTGCAYQLANARFSVSGGGLRPDFMDRSSSDEISPNTGCDEQCENQTAPKATAAPELDPLNPERPYADGPLDPCDIGYGHNGGGSAGTWITITECHGYHVFNEQGVYQYSVIEGCSSTQFFVSWD